MKKSLVSICLIGFAILFGVSCLFGQVPNSFKYQAVVRNNDGDVLVSQAVGVRVSILQESPAGPAV